MSRLLGAATVEVRRGGCWKEEMGLTDGGRDVVRDPD